MDDADIWALASRQYVLRDYSYTSVQTNSVIDRKVCPQKKQKKKIRVKKKQQKFKANDAQKEKKKQRKNKNNNNIIRCVNGIVDVMRWLPMCCITVFVIHIATKFLLHFTLCFFFLWFLHVTSPKKKSWNEGQNLMGQICRVAIEVENIDRHI